MRNYIIFAFLVVIGFAFQGCHDEEVNPNTNLSLDYYSNFKSDSLVVNSHRVREQLNRLIREDSDSMTADYRCRSYYIKRKPFLWIDRHGLDNRADTLLSYLRQVDHMGFSKRKFRVEQIDRDLDRMRRLDFDTARNSVNKVLARLEYNLTKAYLRYTAGQRFGFMNPRYVFNNLDTLDKLRTDSSKYVKYRQLFDLSMEHPTREFYNGALRKVYNDSVAEFLREVQPESPLYKELEDRLLTAGSNESLIEKILSNMERCRWRLNDYPQRYKKYVVVNIPSYRLQAVDGDEVMTMLVGCGTNKTKTPLLYSKIKRMDINPIWNLPRSIIEKSVVGHLGNRSWWENNHYYVRDRRTGKEVDLSRVTWSLLMDKNFGVAQRGGNGNSLGRIIFRFDNNFSIYLHDTDSRDFFSREDRGVSHGCVRVEKPFELAKFMLEDKDEKVIEKLHYSMTADILPKSSKPKTSVDGEVIEPAIKDTLKKNKIIGVLKVEPNVPVFIIYYTLYPDAQTHKITEYADVYGYDRVIYKYLRNYR